MKNKIFLIILIISFVNALTLPKNFSADFTQTITSSNKTLKYKGKVYLKNNYVFWHYIKPIEKKVWITSKVYMYEPDLYQVTISKRPEISLIKIVKNAKKIKNNEYLAKMDKKEIYFIYNKTLKKLWYKDEVGNLVKINFYNQSTKELNSSIFKPTFPNDVDFIYQ